MAFASNAVSPWLAGQGTGWQAAKGDDLKLNPFPVMKAQTSAAVPQGEELLLGATLHQFFIPLGKRECPDWHPWPQWVKVSTVALNVNL